MKVKELKKKLKGQYTEIRPVHTDHRNAVPFTQLGEDLGGLTGKALEIIKEKRVNVGLLLRCATVERYNKGICYEPKHLIQEEYDLLKEELL